MTLPIWARVLRWLFAALLLATAVGKALDMPGFIGVVDSYRVLPGWLLAPSAWALMLTEFVVFAMLVFGRGLLAAAGLLVAMHAMYLVWLSVALLRGLQLDNCGCFGVYLARPLTPFTLVEDALLLAAATALLLACWRARPTQAHAS